MPNIAQQLHQRQPNFWSLTTDPLLSATCGIDVPYAGISYAVHAFESQGDAKAHSLCYVSEGRARVRIDTEFYQVSAGDVVLFQKGHPYAIYPPDQVQPWEWCWIIMAGAPIDDMIREFCWAADRCPLITSTALPFLDITKAMLQAYHLKPHGSLLVGGLLLQLLGHLVHANTATEVMVPHTDHDRQVTEIISYMGRHLTASLTLEGLAMQFCLSPSQLGKLFRRVTGVSPIQYFKYLRIEAAKGLLRSSQSIHAIAAQVGFEDMVTFDRAFKRLTGLTPRQFRRQLNG